MVEAYLLFALANFALGITAVVMCLCRLNSMKPNVRYAVRCEYTLYLSCALASSLQPMWGEWPKWGSLAMLSALVFGLLVSAREWRNGQPEHCTHPGPFEGVC